MLFQSVIDNNKPLLLPLRLIENKACRTITHYFYDKYVGRNHKGRDGFGLAYFLEDLN